MSIEIRPITEAEFAAWIQVIHVAFFQDRDAQAEAAFRRPFTDLSRCLGAFEDDRVVGTFRSLATNVSVPGGGSVAADAITAVTVLPTHRRRGMLRSMMSRDLAEAVGRGEPIAALIASEYPIYGRYGFGVATEHATYAIDTPRVRFLREAPGSVELVQPTAARAIGPDLYEAYRRIRAGSITRRDVTWDVQFGLLVPPGDQPWKGRVVLGRDASGAPDGLLRYHVEERWEERLPRSTLHVDELLATTPDAEQRLWQYACGVDLGTTVQAPDRPVDDILPWLLVDARAVRCTNRADMLWVRILDPAAALSARTYAAAGRLVIALDDPERFASGRFALDGGHDGASCVRTSADADLVAGVAALGSAYLGGVRWRTLAAAGLVTERRAGALATADAMFATWPAPYDATWF
jgi:predicted acetyltransferase